MIRFHGRSVVFAAVLLLLVLAAACTADESATPTPITPSTAAAVTDSGDPDERPARPTPTVNPPVPTVRPSVGRAPARSSVSGKPVPGDATLGGTLTAAIWRDDHENARISTADDTYNPWEDDVGPSFTMMHPLHNLLLQHRTWGGVDDYQKHSFLELHPDLAVGWETGIDGLSVVFTLRDDVTWTDGTPFTCADVAWSFDVIRTGRGLARSPRSFYLEPIREITCYDDHTVQFVLREQRASIIDSIALPQNIIRPQHIYADNPGAMANELPNVTTGPFTVEENVQGERLTYRRNDTYWDQPFPFVSGIDFVFLSTSSLATALRTGMIDVGNPAGYANQDAEMLWRECADCQVWPRILGMGQAHHIILNQTKEPWDNAEIREAISLAIDNTTFIRNIHGGWHSPPTGCGAYPHSSWAMPIERCAQIPGYGDFTTYSSPAADKARAREILENLGYSPGELSTAIFFSEETADDISAVISDFQEVGVNVAPIELSDRDFRASLASGNFDAAVHSEWAISSSLDLLLISQFSTEGNENFGRFSNPDFDALIDQMNAATNFEFRREIAWNALEIALRDQAKIIMSHSVLLPVFGGRVHGMMPGLDYQASRGPHLRYDHVWLTS